MEEITDFDKWLQTFIAEPVEYYAIYNPQTAEVVGIYPKNSAKDIEHKVLIDSDLAESILEGKISLRSCFVDDADDVLQVVQTQSVRKIDDILHRVVSKEFATFEEADLYITFNSQLNTITLSLIEKLKRKKIRWDSHAVLKFLITEYNDPHKVNQVITTTLDDLYNNDQTYQYTGTDKNFSVFTSRVFKNYIFIENENS
jgi:hypothetical protein